MLKYKKFLLYFSMAVVALSILIALSSVNKLLSRGGNMTLPRIDRLFANTKIFCFGRFLIEVPSEAMIIYGPTHLPWPLASYIGKGDQIDDFVANRMAEALEEKKSATGRLLDGDSLVGTIMNGAVQGQKIIFGVSKVSSRIYRIDSFTRIKNDLFVQQADPTADERDVAVSELNSIASALRSRNAFEIPQEFGSCIEAGFVEGPKIDSFELHSLGIRLAEFPDVQLSISVTKKSELVESDALEPRLRQAEQNAIEAGGSGWFNRIKVFRRGPRVIGKWRGFELLARKPAQAHEGASHEFLFVSQGEPDNPLVPLLDLEFHTGIKGNLTGGDKPSVTDDEALAIWDKLTASIRVRPTK